MLNSIDYRIRILIAVLVILIGIAGLILPIIPGIAFICYGLYLINPDWVKSKLRSFRKKK